MAISLSRRADNRRDEYDYFLICNLKIYTSIESCYTRNVSDRKPKVSVWIEMKGTYRSEAVLSSLEVRFEAASFVLVPNNLLETNSECLQELVGLLKSSLQLKQSHVFHK
jgi:hypothetical protein